MILNEDFFTVRFFVNTQICVCVVQTKEEANRTNFSCSVPCVRGSLNDDV